MCIVEMTNVTIKSKNTKSQTLFLTVEENNVFKMKAMLNYIIDI